MRNVIIILGLIISLAACESNTTTPTPDLSDGGSLALADGQEEPILCQGYYHTEEEARAQLDRFREQYRYPCGL